MIGRRGSKGKKVSGLQIPKGPGGHGDPAALEKAIGKVEDEYRRENVKKGAKQ